MFAKDMDVGTIGVITDAAESGIGEGSVVCKSSSSSQWSHYSLFDCMNWKLNAKVQVRLLGPGDTLIFSECGKASLMPRPLQYTDLSPGTFFEDARGDIFVRGIGEKKVILSKHIMECVVGKIRVLTQQEAMGKLSGITK